MDKKWEIPILCVAVVFFTQLVFCLIFLGISIRNRQTAVENRLTTIETRVGTFMDNPQPPVPFLVPKYIPVTPVEEGKTTPTPPNSGKVGSSEK